MMAPRRHSMTWVEAALGLLVLLGTWGGASPGEAPAVGVIVAEGTAEAIEPQDILWNVELNSAFVPTITEIVTEWSRVEAGDVVAELYTPWLEDELREKEGQLRRAESVAVRTEAEAKAALGELASAVLTAEADLRGAEQHLSALQAMPCGAEVEQLNARVAENEARRADADGRLARFTEMNAEGLCSETDLTNARHERQSRAAEAAHLQSLCDRLRVQGCCFEVRRAEVNVEKLKARLAAAGLQLKLESERRQLLCQASREKELGQAQRAYDLSLKRSQALTVYAPAGGIVYYGDRDGYWLHMEGQRFGPGAPVFYGQRIASVIDPGHVRVEAKVAEEDLLRVVQGDRAEVEFPGVPGAVFQGAVESVLSIVWAARRETAQTATEVVRREGRVKVALSDFDERVRPGMKARARIFSAPGDVRRPAAASDGRAMVVLHGNVDTESTHQVRCPFQGRVVSLVPTGTPVERGQVIATLAPELTVDWRAQDLSEAERLAAICQAAEIQAQLKEQLVPFLVAGAEADVRLAELAVEELDGLPDAPERIQAENQRAEAEWQLDRATRRLDACRELVAQGISRQTDLRQAELQVTSAKASLTEADAALQDVLAGPPELERTAAAAELKKARAVLARTRALAELDLKAAKADVTTAAAELAAHKAQAERRLQRAGQAEIRSPVNGLVAWCWAEKGTELQEGSHFMGIADMEQAAVHAMLDESDYFKVTRGAPARVRLAGVPGQTFSGHVTDVVAWPEMGFWMRQYTGETRVRDGQLFQVIVALDGEPPLCIGMSATVEVFAAPEGGADAEAGEGETTSSEGVSHGQPD